MRKRKLTPAEVKLLDAIEKDRRAFERWYARMRRAVAAMEKARRRVSRGMRRLEKLDQDTQPQPSPHP
jgi:hypothetical protein